MGEYTALRFPKHVRVSSAAFYAFGFHGSDSMIAIPDSEPYLKLLRDLWLTEEAVCLSVCLSQRLGVSKYQLESSTQQSCKLTVLEYIYKFNACNHQEK
jgi:hypothetical protein